MKKKLRKGIKLTQWFINDGVWAADLDELSKMKARAIRFLQIAIVTLKTFAQQKIGPQAVALSYFCTMAIIPFLAIIFAITGGLGLESYLMEFLQSSFKDKEVVQFLMEKAEYIIDTAKSGMAGLISALTFLWLVLWMMFNVEGSFNDVWKVEKNRNIFKRFGWYIAVTLITPFVLLLFLLFPVIYSNIFNLVGLDLKAIPILNTIVPWLGFYVIAGFTLTAMYKFIPAAHVHYHNAWRAAFLTAAVFTGFQYVYLESQVFVTRWNAVLGVVAAVPLLMIWLNMSWQIILYGAELSYALQNVDSFSSDLQNSGKKNDAGNNEVKNS